MGGGASKGAATVKVVSAARMSTGASHLQHAAQGEVPPLDAPAAGQQENVWSAPEEQGEAAAPVGYYGGGDGDGIERESAPYSFVPVAPEPQVGRRPLAL